MVNIYAKNVQCPIHDAAKKIMLELRKLGSDDNPSDALALEIKIFGEDIERMTYDDLKKRTDLRFFLTNALETKNLDAKRALLPSYHKIKDAIEQYRIDLGYTVHVK